MIRKLSHVCSFQHVSFHTVHAVIDWKLFPLTNVLPVNSFPARSNEGENRQIKRKYPGNGDIMSLEAAQADLILQTVKGAAAHPSCAALHF